ncbi:MAG TPA: ATP-binding protein, partial [Candidatus Aenigmarchaeota archaeon]|nr:ATP-binding protein [Candidatus Aenigmarchaeota archaeon]
EYLFFDEIQNLERWESFVYSLFEKKRYFIFITGSSSKLLSEEIATQLRGRSLTILVLPFSFKEFLQVKGLHVKTKILLSYEESKIKNLLRLYLKEGGFPDIVLTSINREEYFRDYINLVVFRDIVERYKIRDIGLIKMFVRFAISSFSKEFSIHKIYRTFKSMNVKVSKKTLYRYADMLEDAQFCFFLRKFSFSERESLLSIPKVFLNDPGIANYGRTTKFDEEIGKLMENAVFLELKRKKLETFYWRDYQGNEVDFVVKEGLKVKQLIQVTYANDRDEIREREIKDLMKSSELLKCKDLLCITWDYEGEEKIKGKKVKFVPLWKWLMNI